MKSIWGDMSHVGCSVFFDRAEFFLQLLGWNSVEFFDIGAKMTVVKVVEFLADFVKVHSFRDHAFCEKRAVVAEEVFRFEADGGFDVALELDGGEAELGGDFFDIEAVLLGERQEIDAGFVVNSIAFAMKRSGCDRSTHRE